MNFRFNQFSQSPIYTSDQDINLFYAIFKYPENETFKIQLKTLLNFMKLLFQMNFDKKFLTHINLLNHYLPPILKMITVFCYKNTKLYKLINL